MLAIIILVAAGIGFYAFIGAAPKEAVQLMLFLFWCLLGLLTVGGIVYGLIPQPRHGGLFRAKTPCWSVVHRCAWRGASRCPAWGQSSL